MFFDRILVVCLVISLMIGCGGRELPEKYHMEKKYWDFPDYEEAIRQIRYHTPAEEGLPRLSDPFTSAVFSKLVDKENVSIILEDESLGYKFRNEEGQKFFEVGRDLVGIYSVLDNQDKFVYPSEYVDVLEFFLHTQILYFKMGNAAIVKDAANPDAWNVKNILKDNEQTVADNFHIYLGYLSREDALDEAALKKSIHILEVYYPRLIDEFKTANFAKIKDTSLALSKKVKSRDLQVAFEKIAQKISERIPV